MLGGDHASAIDALDKSAAVGIRYDTADKNRRLRHRLGFRGNRADVQNALHGLRHENLPIRQSPRGVARRCLAFFQEVVPFVRMSHASGCEIAEQRD